MKLHISDKWGPNSGSAARSEMSQAIGANRISTGALQVPPSVAVVTLRYWAALRRNLWRIIAFVAATVLLTAIFLQRIPKEYEGTATIRVDPFVPVDMVGYQTESSSGFDMGAQLATDVKEVVSPSVVIPAITRLGMMNPTAGGDSASSSAFLAKITHGIKVNQVSGTYLLDISYRGASAEQAAAVANALAGQFMQHEYETRSGSLLSLSQYMRQQVQELGDRMKDSQLALETFERNNNIVNPDIMSSSLNQQLASLQQEVGQEEAQQRSLDADLALAKEGNLDALEVSGRGNVLAPLLQARQQAEVEFASLASQYGKGNYLYQQEQRKLADINDTIQTEQKHVTAQIEAQARAAAVQVGLTTQQLADVKAQLDNFSQKNVQFAILKQTSDTDKTLYNNLLERLDSADITAGYHSTALRIINPAHPNFVPVYPRVQLTLLFAFLLSSVLGVIGAIAATNIDRTLCDPGTVRDLLGVELFGFLPEAIEESELKAFVTDGLLRGGNRTPFVEALLGIRSTLLLRQPRASLRSVAVISCMPEEGKTTVAINLAASFAALGKRTVIVDGDLLRPRVHRAASVSNRMGLSSLLLEQADLEDVLRPGPIDRLTILPAGPASGRARELIANGIEGVIEELESRFDIVIIDTLPMLGFADTLSIAAAVDETVLVVRAEKTPQEYVQVVIEQLRQVQAPVNGIVLNCVKSQSSPYYQWYSYDHYRQYSAHAGEP